MRIQCRVASYRLTMSDITLEQRFAIEFMHREGETTVNVYNRLRAVYGEQCISRTQSFLWFKRFREGRMSTDNDTRSGRPPTAVSDEKVKAVDNLIRGDRRIRVKDIMSTLNIGANAADRIIHERAVREWIRKTPSAFFEEGIFKLVPL